MRLILKQWRLTMKSGMFPMKWWMLTLVQMEMVNQELFVTVIKPWWLRKKWRPGTHPWIMEANSEAVWAKMRAIKAVLTFAAVRTISMVYVKSISTIG
jgi:hypothetical protein